MLLMAQEETINNKKNKLEFSGGYTSGALQNLAFAPVRRYNYNALNYRLKYTRITKREKLVEVQLDYLNSELETIIIPEQNPEYSKIMLSFSALKQIYKNDKLKIHLGLQTQTNASSYFDWEFFDLQQKLGIKAGLNYTLDSKHSINATLTFPFILGRISSFEDGFYSLGKYQSILWTTGYKFTLSRHLDLKANYNFNYDRLQIFEAYREVQHQFNLGINFKF